MSRRKKKKEFSRIDIIDIAAKGKCVGRTEEGEIVLVDDVVPGDIISGNALRKRKGMWMVRPDQFHEYSTDRVEPPCAHFADCGGCKWQHLNIEQQLSFKQKQVFETMKRIGGYTDFDMRPIVPSPRSYQFRNKMEFSFSDKRWLGKHEIDATVDIQNAGGLGLHPPGRFDKVVDLEACHLIPEHVNDIRNFVRDTSRELGLTFYNARGHIGDMRNLMMRINRAGDIMVVFIFGSQLTDKHQQLMSQTQENFPQIVSIYSILNQKANDSTFDLNAELIYGDQYLTEHIGSTQFKIGPKSFFQTNIYQTEQLYEEVRQLAQLSGSEIVFDLYSGIGSIALYLADQAREMVAIEDVSEAVADAKINAKLNGVDHISYHSGKMEKLIEANQLHHLPKPDVIITDPPRAGMHEAVVRFILDQEAKRIVYVSCDPATQARDIKMLSEKYKLISLQPFDMFPHTSHVEAVALLEIV